MLKYIHVVIIYLYRLHYIHHIDDPGKIIYEMIDQQALTSRSPNTTTDSFGMLSFKHRTHVVSYNLHNQYKEVPDIYIHAKNKS